MTGNSLTQIRSIRWLFIALGALLSGQAAALECEVSDPVYPEAYYPQVKFSTSQGDFVVELNRRRAPVTVNNFLRYLAKGAYNNTIFHRVVADFVVQGGGYHPDLADVEELAAIVNESGNGLANQTRSIAMARHDDPHSATSQFFFNLQDNESLNPNRRNWGYTVFGEVIEGWEVVEAIGATETGFSDDLNATDVPVTPVILKSAVLQEP
ncbi:MAG: peptidylprolyl isomerase [Pseudomonadota bacterium]